MIKKAFVAVLAIAAIALFSGCNSSTQVAPTLPEDCVRAIQVMEKSIQSLAKYGDAADTVISAYEQMAFGNFAEIQYRRALMEEEVQSAAIEYQLMLATTTCNVN